MSYLKKLSILSKIIVLINFSIIQPFQYSSSMFARSDRNNLFEISFEIHRADNCRINYALLRKEQTDPAA